MKPEPPNGTSLRTLRAEMQALGSPAAAAQSLRFFKTGPGDYGEGDQFLGIRVPVLRGLVRKYRGLPWREAVTLLKSDWHEERLLALLLWVDAFSRGDATKREAIHRAYLDHTAFINNWDLVDASAEHIVGGYLYPGGIGLLVDLAGSKNLWERRIAILSTFHYIRRDEFKPTLRIARMLIEDPHDLIHKAVGWLLREVGKRNQEVEEGFLRTEAWRMPRTMLRYAVERFPEPVRKRYLAMKSAA